jgi:hypothetical protein
MGRRTASGIGPAEETSFRYVVVEKALAHSIDNKIEAGYRRGDLKKRRGPIEA